MATTVSIAQRDLPAAAGAKVQTAGRLIFVDNIRVFLTVLVILHHLMIVYAGTGDWYYMEGRQDTITTALGALFCSINQSYFMGLFLLISAYFVPGSYDRKGAGRFLKDRLIRLGIPLAIFSWIINPLFIYAGSMLADGLQMPLWRFMTTVYFRGNPVIGAGPLWFVEVLLILSLVYVIWRLVVPAQRTQPTVEASFPSYGAIAVFAVLLGVAGFVVRLWRPFGWVYKPLNLQLPFFTQYIALFIVGLVAYRRNWLLALPDRVGRASLAAMGVLLVLWVIILVTGGALESDLPFRGGWRWQALAYAVLESFICVAMCISVVYLFRRAFNQQTRIGAFLVPTAYTAYIIHAPVITTLAFALRDVMIYPLLKWVLVGALALALCFGLSALIRKIPYADRVL